MHGLREHTCHLKTSDAGRRHNPSFTSGSSTAPPPPAPAPAPGAAVSALATMNGSDTSSLRLFLGLWSAAGVDNPVSNTTVEVSLHGLHFSDAKEWRIDSTHANAHTAWVAMHGQGKANAEQLAALIAASVVHPCALAATDGVLTVTLETNSAVVLSFE